MDGQPDTWFFVALILSALAAAPSNKCLTRNSCMVNESVLYYEGVGGLTPHGGRRNN